MKLHEYEWRYLLQMVSRIYCAPTYREALFTLSQQMQTLIPFDNDIFYRTSRENGRPVIADFYTTTSAPTAITEGFLHGNYPRWSEFIMSSSSSIFTGKRAAFIKTSGSLKICTTDCLFLLSTVISPCCCLVCCAARKTVIFLNVISLFFNCCRTVLSTSFTN